MDNYSHINLTDKPTDIQLVQALTEAKEQRAKAEAPDYIDNDVMYAYFDGKVSGLRYALGLSIEEPVT